MKFCGRPVSLGEQIAATRTDGQPDRGGHVKLAYGWYIVRLGNPQYTFCGHDPHGLEQIACWECVVREGLVW